MVGYSVSIQLSSSYLRRSFQLLAQLGSEKISGDEAFERASNIIYEWAKRKYSSIFRQMPYFKETLDDRRDGNEIGIIYEPENNLFIFRGAHPDAHTPGRLWTTDVQISKHDAVYYFAARLSVTSLQSCNEEVPYSCPTFIRDIINTIGLFDIIQISDKPHFISTQDDAQHFVDFLESTSRFMPVLLLSPCYYEDNAEHNGYTANAYQIAKHLRGVAHVFCTTIETNDYLRDQIGSQWIPYNGAVRTYYPNLSFSESDLYQHPLLTPQQIQFRKANDNDQSGSWIRDVETHIQLYSVRQRVPWQECGMLFYLSAHQELIKKQRIASVQSEEQLIALYEEQINQMQKQCDESLAIADAYANDYENAIAENEQLRQQFNRLKGQISTLRSALESALVQQGQETIPIYNSYSEMAAWIDQYYADKLLLHPRAKRSLKNACYEDVPLVYKCLSLLATSYYDYRMGLITYDDFRTAYKNIDSGLEESGAITDIAAGMEGETYFVQYKGQKHKLDRHLTKGNDKDKRYCLRIYFFWDSQEQLVVIGDLPHHLDTRAT